MKKKKKLVHGGKETLFQAWFSHVYRQLAEEEEAKLQLN